MKKGELRREALLETAERLFCTKGYEQTAVQDILDALQYSKGGFYHHFNSKLELLEAICQKRAAQAVTLAQEAASGEAESAAARLNAVLKASTLWNDRGEGFAALLIRVAYRPDSALMRERMKDCQLQGLQPVLEEVLLEGQRAGEFFLPDISASARLVLRLYMQFADEIAFLFSENLGGTLPGDQLISVLATYRVALERILLAPFGSIELFEADELQRLWMALRD